MSRNFTLFYAYGSKIPELTHNEPCFMMTAPVNRVTIRCIKYKNPLQRKEEDTSYKSPVFPFFPESARHFTQNADDFKACKVEDLRPSPYYLLERLHWDSEEDTIADWKVKVRLIIRFEKDARELIEQEIQHNREYEERMARNNARIRAYEARLLSRAGTPENDE